ncbi:conserved hypothetical protein [Talaromyces stipitatus ATCC 10500]|uniref:BTB domain-containing protein n=1 Tax=Talaromyces stipitatus (strain ATCC 10500 / CBS 375.48 / QM 6759 / NRRL 1006) TaxID=441959 RepID=B8M5H9_TALSN|nr:uncharacterized protein TSTA_031330 [Talaromyces stipitatus ATCC 10500]EED19873.1 conserved hypothetical protein [Talaromyces stipitatus ATCC 10500]
MAMVSYPETVDRTHAPPPASSSSRLSHSSRRHRHGRSHHGGSSYTAQNEFPIFAHTGDVEIVIAAGGQEKRYLLHRLILSQCSGFFEASTSEEWSRSQAQAESASAAVDSDPSLQSIAEDGSSILSRRGSAQGSSMPPKLRWRYELDWQNKESDEDPILVQKPPTSDPIFAVQSSYSIPPPQSITKPVAPRAGFFRSVANLAGMQSAVHIPSNAVVPDAQTHPLIRDYDNLFRIFYNFAPILNSVNIATAYSECKALLGLADMYDALGVVGSRIDHHLLRFSSRLFKQIAKYPPSYLKLGYLARSRVIFTEALIHVVGQWPAAQAQLNNGSFSPLPDTVLDLIEDKVDDLEDLKTRIDAKLFRLTLTTSRGERVSPSNAYLDWLAVSLFRQWFVENTTPPPAPILKNSGESRSVSASADTRRSAGTPIPSGRVYRLIGSSSSEAYLPHDELKRFLKLKASSTSESLYTRDNFKRFERKMDEIKRLAREVVKPLIRNFLELDLKGSDHSGGSGGSGVGDGGIGGLPYLTCTRIEEADLPWR